MNNPATFGILQTMKSWKTTILPLAIFVAFLMQVLPSYAHSGDGFGDGFISGFTHPILGWDHVAAMVAVGLWGAILGAPAIWLLPVIFPIVMAFGCVLGVLSFPIPMVETGIAASGLILGLLILAAMKLPLWGAGLIVGFFAIFHGYAHGVELPGNANAFYYALGFVVSTGLLHLLGVCLGILFKWPYGKAIVRACGGLISLAGLAFLFG